MATHSTPQKKLAANRAYYRRNREKCLAQQRERDAKRKSRAKEPVDAKAIIEAWRAHGELQRKLAWPAPESL